MSNEKKILELIERKSGLFSKDINNFSQDLSSIVEENNFLIIGGAGSIGQAVSKEIFKRSPKTLHVVDINENNLTELVRDIRSTLGYINGDFRTFCIDCGSLEFETFIS